MLMSDPCSPAPARGVDDEPADRRPGDRRGREHSADHTFCRYARRLARDGGGGAALVYHLAQLHKHARALFEHSRTAAERIHDAKPRKLRLLVDEDQQRGETGAHTLAPRGFLLECLHHPPLHLLEGTFENGQETVLAIDEQVIERLARHFCTADHLRDGETCVPVLLDRLDRRAEHSGALDLGYVTARESVVSWTQRWRLGARLID